MSTSTDSAFVAYGRIGTSPTPFESAQFRVFVYWDMAASMVTTGAIDVDAFRVAHGDIFATFSTFSKIQPFLAEMQSTSGDPEF